MTELHVIRRGQVLIPESDQDVEALATLPANQPLKATVAADVNSRFRRKWFSLVRFAYQQWTPTAIEYKGYQVTPDFDVFRKDVTILAGFYTAHARINGTVSLQAKSIAWKKMDDAEFSRLYSATIDVILQKVLPDLYQDSDQLEDAVAKALEYA